MTSPHLITLNNGLKLPALGIGTSDLDTQEQVDVLIKAIVEDGYRHLDTASFYKNEEQIGKVLKSLIDSKQVKREELFIVTKVWVNETSDPETAIRNSLKRLQLDYVDLYLIHWPVSISNDDHKDPVFSKQPMHVIWKSLENLVKLGLTKSIGVSNFNFQLLNDLLTYAEILPVCNQIELNPYLNQFHLVEWLKSKNIVPVAYTPLGRPSLNKDKNNLALYDPKILEIASKHNASPGQIILAWGLSRGHSIIPKTSSSKRSKENWDSQFIKLSKEEVEEINHLNKNFRVIDPRKSGGFGGVPIFE